MAKTKAETNATKRAWVAANRNHELARRRRRHAENRDADNTTERARQSKLRRLRKIQLIAMLGGRCQDCGAEFPAHPEVFEFDHRNPADKQAQVSLLLAHSLKRLMDEVQKCDLVCANCHRIRTSKQGWGNGYEARQNKMVTAGSQEA